MPMDSEKLIDGEKLIELVRARSFLYDPKHPHHKNRNVVPNAWNEIAKEVGCRAEEAKKRWRYTRDKYFKKKKLLATAKRRGAGADRIFKILSSWDLFQQLSWLDDTAQHEETHENCYEKEQLDLVNYSDMVEDFSQESPTKTIDMTLSPTELHTAGHEEAIIAEITNASPQVEFATTSPVDDQMESRKDTSTPIRDLKRKHFLSLKKKRKSAHFQETLISAIQQSTAIMSKMVTTIPTEDIFDDYGRVVSKRLKDLGKKKASEAFTKILSVIDEYDSDA